MPKRPAITFFCKQCGHETPRRGVVFGDAFELGTRRLAVERPQDVADEVAREVPRRFARLQRRYGRWGLAWLESLVRAADALASQANERRDAGTPEPAAAPARRAAR